MWYLSELSRKYGKDPLRRNFPDNKSKKTTDNESGDEVKISKQNLEEKKKEPVTFLKIFKIDMPLRKNLVIGKRKQ